MEGVLFLKLWDAGYIWLYQFPHVYVIKPWYVFFGALNSSIYSLQGAYISHLKKGKSSSSMPWEKDMLVPRRVYVYHVKNVDWPNSHVEIMALFLTTRRGEFFSI